jgi:hypothetical protein
LIARLVERAEASTASAMEELDATDSFGVLLARTAENAAAPSRIGTEALDLALTAATPLEVVSTYRTTTLYRLGWWIATVCAMHCALGNGAVRNLVLLTAPVGTRGSLYARWIGHDEFDPEVETDGWPSVPGQTIEVANKLMKPVTDYWSTYRRLWQDVLAGMPARDGWQPMAKLVPRPTVPRPRLPRVTGVDAPREPARARPPAPARRLGSTCAGSTRTCSWSP